MPATPLLGRKTAHGTRFRTWSTLSKTDIIGTLPSSYAYHITPRSFVSGHVVRDEKCGLGTDLKSETISLTFLPSRFRLAGGEFSEHFWERTAREKHFKLLAFGLMLIG